MAKTKSVLLLFILLVSCLATIFLEQTPAVSALSSTSDIKMIQGPVFNFTTIGTTTSLTLTFDNQPLIGDTLILAFAGTVVTYDPDKIVSITQTSVTWTKIVNSTTPLSSGATVEIWAGQVIDAPAEKTITVNTLFTNNGPNKAFIAYEYSGISTTSFLDQTNTTTTRDWTGVISNAVPNALAIGVVCNSDVATTWGTPTNGFSKTVSSDTNGRMVYLNKTTSSLVSGPVSSNITGADNSGLGCIATFHPISYNYRYTFNGVYDENTGLQIGGCDITAYFDDGTAPCTFFVDQSITYTPQTQPLYFDYNIQPYANTTDTTINRQYWLQTNENSGYYNIFGNQIGLVHIIFQIRALGGIGLSSFLEVQRIINGTYQTVEQRQVDATGVATMSLQPYTIYRVIALSGDVSTTFGNINTYTTPIILTLSALSFPSTVLSQYKYVHIYASRPDATTIQVSYEDTDNQTLSVAYEIKNNLGVTVYTNTHTNESSFIDVWLGASANTTYYLSATVTQSRFGVSTYSLPLFGSNAQTSPINLSIFGNFGNIDSSQIIWIIIILAVFLCFSALNSWLGAFCGVATAAIFMYLGWLNISEGVIVTAFGFVILAAIAAWKHRST